MDLFPADPNYNNSKGVSYITGFFMLIGFALIGLVVSTFISLMIIAAFTGGNIGDMKEVMKDPANAGMLRLAQVISVTISMFIPSLAAAGMLSRKPFQLLGFRKDAGLNQVGYTILIMLVSIVIASSITVFNKELADMAGLGGWAERLEKNYNQQVSLMLDMDDTWGYLVSIMLMAFLPALCEEMLFRGGLQNFLTRATRSPWLSILIISILFSIVHFSVYGFVVRFFLGIVLGTIFHYTQNLWLSITAHFFNNALAVTAIYFFMKQGNNLDEAMAKDVPASYWGLLAIPLLVLLFRSLKRTAGTEADVK